MVRLTFLEKSSYFNWIIDLFAYSILKKYRNYIESVGCSNSTKLISQNDDNVWVVMQKEWSA